MTVAIKPDVAALSASEPGHWRNKFWSQSGWANCDPAVIHLDSKTCITVEIYESEGEAQSEGHDLAQKASDPNDRWYEPDSLLIYLGAVFFANGDAQ